MSRVRVIDQPMTRFQQWADWAADFNRAAGETIYLLDRATAQDLDLIGDPMKDWWLLDDHRILIMSFASDGSLIDVADGEQPSIEAARQVRDAVRRYFAQSGFDPMVNRTRWSSRQIEGTA